MLSYMYTTQWQYILMLLPVLSCILCYQMTSRLALLRNIKFMLKSCGILIEHL